MKVTNEPVFGVVFTQDGKGLLAIGLDRHVRL